MNLDSLSYFAEVARELNMTKAAHNLHMTQQTLSFHIQKLEEYYGTPLFYRRPKFRLTYAGELLLENSAEILSKCDSLMDQMASISGACVGKLRIGISTYPAQVILPLVLPQFLRKWPNVSLFFPKQSMAQRPKSILDGKLDICIGIYNGSDPYLSTEFLYDDQLYLVVSDALLQKHYGTQHTAELKQSEKTGTDLRAFSTLPLMTLSISSHLGSVVNEYFAQMKIKPNIIMETQSLDMLVPLVPRNIGALICGRLRLTEIMKLYPDVNAFPVRNDSAKSDHHFKLITLKNRVFPEYGQDFIGLVREAFDGLERFTFT